MANSLRNKIKHFCYKGELTESERNRILNALDDADRINSELNRVKTELKQQLCDDCISREEAINAAINAVDEWDGGCNTSRATMISHAIKHLPSVTPNLETGHWIDTGSGQMCSKCGEIQYGYDNFRRFCASCGAKIEESEK